MQNSKTVSLPMYDFPEIRAATDAWWAGISRHLEHERIKVASELIHNKPVRELWSDENLLLSQRCGFDVVFGYKEVLNALVTPVYAVDGCTGGYYWSRVVVREDSGFNGPEALRDTVAAINGAESHSGMNALLTLIQPLSVNGRFFRKLKLSGAHAESLRMVQEGQADVAAIDCVTYALLERYRPEAVAGVVTIARTDLAPALPYVTRKAVSIEQQQRMRTALSAAFHDPELAVVREALLLKGVVEKPPEFYRAIADNFGFDDRLLGVIA